MYGESDNSNEWRDTMMEAKREEEVPVQDEALIVGSPRVEMFHFGEASIRVRENEVNAWTCSTGETVIGMVRYNPKRKHENSKGKKDFGFSAYHASDGRPDGHDATGINIYPSLRGAVQAVVACHYSGKVYTYIRDNICVLDGKVVPEAVYKGRQVLKKTLS